MPIKAWVSSLQQQLTQSSRYSGLKARRRESRFDPATGTEHLEQRALLTALVINSENQSDFSAPSRGITINNGDLAGFDSLVIESVAFGGIDGAGIDIDLSGINLTSIAIESVTIADYGTVGIDLDLNNLSLIHI